MTGPVLDTPRLLLRPPRLEDLEGWTALASDPESARFIGGVQPPFGAWRSLSAMAGSWSLQGFGMFSVIEKATGAWIGRIGPWHPVGWPGPEIGWGILRSTWGKGLALEAATASMDWAFGTLGWDRAVHLIHPDNAPSRALAGRLGSRLLGPASLPPPFAEEPAELWGQTATEWRVRRAPG
ncbi:N-acetyltransferase [Falsiroseomonas bella]|uniref:N-acetyltransferase n=1 Tax=Falsiroseomonas bella TaxID=2184016 RepID=A0A317F7E3_9PROT|nr:GNAT family N-acetyltransferase [Falsiroseomonas bella]PWS34974.1 N-acetyltransferase [Falsiroseomonas bella]